MPSADTLVRSLGTTVGCTQGQYFLKLLKEHLTKDIRITAVARTEKEGTEVFDRIKGAQDQLPRSVACIWLYGVCNQPRS